MTTTKSHLIAFLAQSPSKNKKLTEETASAKGTDLQCRASSKLYFLLVVLVADFFFSLITSLVSVFSPGLCFSLHLLVLPRPRHSRWDKAPPHWHMGAGSAMCPAGWIPICLTLYDVCFLHNSRALLTHSEPAWHCSQPFHTITVQVMATRAGYSSCLAAKFSTCLYQPPSYFTFSSDFSRLPKII